MYSLVNYNMVLIAQCSNFIIAKTNFKTQLQHNIIIIN